MKQTGFLKYVAVVLAVMLLVPMLPTVVGAAGGSISLSTAGGSAGSTVTVTVDFANNPGMASAILQVVYPSELTLVDVKDGGKLGATSHKNSLTNPYVLAWINDTATTNFTYNGTVATLSFKIPEGAAAGTQYPITLSYDYENYDIMNVNSEPVRFTLSGTFITVGGSTPATTTQQEAITTTAQAAVTTATADGVNNTTAPTRATQPSAAKTTSAAPFVTEATAAPTATDTTADTTAISIGTTADSTAISTATTTAAVAHPNTPAEGSWVWWLAAILCGAGATVAIAFVLRRKKE